MTIQLTPEAKGRLHAHLDAVEAALREAGKDREERRGIVDDLEAQALDMLGASGTEIVGAAEVHAVLARLDPPGAYGTPTESLPAPIMAQAPQQSTDVERIEQIKRRATMKSAVCIVLIVCGSLLVAAPSISDYLYHCQLVQLGSLPSISPDVHINLQNPMEDGSNRFGFYLTGNLAIGFGIFGAFKAFAEERRALHP